MSFSTLGIGASALAAAQRGVETAAHNIANSSVEGYTRQRVELATAPPTPGTAGMRGSGMRGNGVQVVTVDRLRSTLNDLAVRAGADRAGGTAARAQVLDRTQDVLGPYGGGLPESLSRLFDAFSALANNPSGPAVRQATLDAASQVAGGLNDAASQLAQIRRDNTSQLGDEATEVNGLTRSVAELNDSIAAALAAGQAPNDLLDTRDLALDRLAALAGASSTRHDNGVVDVTIGGQPVVTGSDSVEVTLTSTPPPAGSVGDDPVLQVGGATVVAGGSMGGRVRVATTDLRDIERQLDDVATTIQTAVNDQHAQGYDLHGNAGGPVFVGASARDIAVDPALTPDRLAASGRQVVAGNALDGENATALAALRQAGPGGVSLGDRLVGLATTLGSRAGDAARSADAADASLSGLTEQRSAADGVSLDEEMVDLVRFQHSYDAASRVISIADGMLDTIINRMGAGR